MSNLIVKTSILEDGSIHSDKVPNVSAMWKAVKQIFAAHPCCTIFVSMEDGEPFKELHLETKKNGKAWMVNTLKQTGEILTATKKPTKRQRKCSETEKRCKVVKSVTSQPAEEKKDECSEIINIHADDPKPIQNELPENVIEEIKSIEKDIKEIFEKVG